MGENSEDQNVIYLDDNVNDAQVQVLINNEPIRGFLILNDRLAYWHGFVNAKNKDAWVLFSLKDVIDGFESDVFSGSQKSP